MADIDLISVLVKGKRLKTTVAGTGRGASPAGSVSTDAAAATTLKVSSNVLHLMLDIILTFVSMKEAKK
jgi:hypothetical protein